MYDDDIDGVSDHEAAEGQGGGDGGNVGENGAKNVGGSSVHGSFEVAPIEEEMYTPPIAKFRTKPSSSAFDITSLY